MKMSAKRFFWIPLLASLLLSGCSIDESGVVGKYKLNNTGKGNTAYLELAKDHKYTLSIEIQGQPNNIATGTWAFDAAPPAFAGKPLKAGETGHSNYDPHSNHTV